jgi:hypothetical protein
MQDDDWMVPRRFHTPEAEESHGPFEAPNMRVDSEFLRQRELRKQTIPTQPTTSNGEDNPWLDFDRSIARNVPEARPQGQHDEAA